MNTASLPSRRDEAWRYSDIDAVVAAWHDDGAGNTVIASGSDMIVIMGVTTSQLYANDFLIV